MLSSNAGPLTVLIPVHNEAGIIRKVIADISVNVVGRVPGAELIVVEDGSTDGTQEILEELRREFPFELLSGKERLGYTAAFKAALRAARGELIFFCDSDGQHEAADFFRLKDAMGDGDIVSGRKAPRRDPFHRVFLAAGYNLLIRLMFGLAMKDIDSGFKLIRRRVVDDILERVVTMKYCVMSEFVLRAHLAGYAVREVPVRHFPRPSGTTAIFSFRKLPAIVFRVFGDLWRIRQECIRTRPRCV